MKRARIGGSIGCAALLLIGTIAPAGAAVTRTPAPGTVNYVEGSVTVNGRELLQGSKSTNLLGTDQALDTGRGKAELLLTPGVFLRVGDNSEVRMISPGLADTQVSLIKGSAMVEAADLFKENRLSVLVNGATARIDKKGLYEFTSQPAAVSVLDGKATVYDGDAHVDLKKGHEALITGGDSLQTQKFDTKSVEDSSLYRWSKLRSRYESEANADAARMVVINGGSYGPGWYWDPYWSFYSFLPANGAFYSPFGWGFYSPWTTAWYGARYHQYPLGAIGLGRGYARSPWTGHMPIGARPPMTGRGFRGARGFAGGFRGGSAGLRR